MNHPTNNHRTAVTTGLRRLADYLDHNPDVPIGSSADTFKLHYCVDVHTAGGDLEHTAEVERIARYLGVTPQQSPAGHYKAVKQFGAGVTYEARMIPDAVMARHNAGWTYVDSVTPEAAS